jgi:antitoxin component of RelBE/YafQ-DinJ toxin-antitoxin module
MPLKPKPLKEKTIGIRIDTETKKALEKMAQAADRSLSDFIRIELKKIASSKGSNK